MSVCLSVSQSNTLVQTEIPEQHLDVIRAVYLQKNLTLQSYHDTGVTAQYVTIHCNLNVGKLS